MLSTIILLSSCLSVYGLWHPYDALKTYEPQCANSADNFKEKTKSVSKVNQDKWKLWPDVISQKDIIEGETMYGFEDGMEAIWKNQHPADCKTAKYLISGGYESGFGSEFHVLGVGLALAMNMNRVYIMFSDGQNQLTDKLHSNNGFQVDIDYCKKQNKLSLECYFEPWTHCTIEDALQGQTIQQLRSSGLHIYDHELAKLGDNAPAHAYIAQLGDTSDILPKALHNIYACSPFRADKYRYWWRSVSAAFMMRPNAPTRELIVQHRQDKEMAFDFNKEQCVSVHIRRGDKHLEMKVIDNEKVFYDMAKTLWTGVKNRTHTTQERGIMFVGSEDAGVFDTASAWGKNNNFDVKYTNLFDRKLITTGLNNDQQQEARKKNAFVHHEWEYFNMILTLDGHLRCSAFVCTQRSNYCRVIDELRATVGHKANKQLADFTCSPNPCIDSSDTGIDWRR